MGIERMLAKVVFVEDGRQQERADRAPALVDIDRGVRGQRSVQSEPDLSAEASTPHC